MIKKCTGEGDQTRDEGRQRANQHEPGRGKHPHLSRRGAIQITMINIIHTPTGRDGMRRGGNEIIRERYKLQRFPTSRRKTAIRFRTWKDMAERRNEVIDMVAQAVSWTEAGGTNRFVRLPMSLIRPRACVLRKEPNKRHVGTRYVWVPTSFKGEFF